MENFSKSILVRFEYFLVEDINRMVRATIFYPKRNWRWELRLRNYEVVHGLSRIVRLLPLKLNLAKSIRDQNYAEEDGTSMIKTVEDLTKRYLDVHLNTMANLDLSAPDGLRSFEITLGPEADNMEAAENDLDLVMSNYRQRVTSIQEHLRRDPVDAFVHDALDLVELSDDILMMCHVFLDLIHPVWIELSRKIGPMSDQRLQQRKEEGESSLINVDKKLMTEYLGFRSNNPE